jgi:hypothetical protein
MGRWKSGRMENLKKKLCCSDAVLRMFTLELFRRNRKMKLCDNGQ